MEPRGLRTDARGRLGRRQGPPMRREHDRCLAAKVVDCHRLDPGRLGVFILTLEGMLSYEKRVLHGGTPLFQSSGIFASLPRY